MAAVRELIFRDGHGSHTIGNIDENTMSLLSIGERAKIHFDCAGDDTIYFTKTNNFEELEMSGQPLAQVKVRLG